MLLTCQQSHNEIFEAGKEYNLIQPFRNCWTDETGKCSADLTKFESHQDRFLRLCGTAGKFIMEIPTTGHMVDLLVTDKHYIVYSHRPGSHWNIGGSHYYYFHDITTGEFQPMQQHGENRRNIPLLKEKIRKATAEKFVKILKDRYNVKSSPVLVLF
jgi:hypothetical protein